MVLPLGLEVLGAIRKQDNSTSQEQVSKQYSSIVFASASASRFPL